MSVCMCVCVHVCVCIPVRGKTDAHKMTNCLSSKLCVHAVSLICLLYTTLRHTYTHTHSHLSGLPIRDSMCVLMALLTWGPRTPHHSLHIPNGHFMDDSPPLPLQPQFPFLLYPQSPPTRSPWSSPLFLYLLNRTIISCSFSKSHISEREGGQERESQIRKVFLIP